MGGNFWQAVKYWVIDHIPMRCDRCGKLRWRKNGYWVAYARGGHYTEEWVCNDCTKA